MKIYGDKRSGNCYKIQLTCAFLSINYDWVDIDILKGDTNRAEFLDKNPNGKIPMLELDDQRILVESNAIINYLAFNSNLLPQNAYDLAKVQQWQFFEQYSHEPNIAVARFIEKYLGMPKERLSEYQAKHQGGYKALMVMEQQLQHSEFIAGDVLTVADISLYAYTHVAHEGGFDLAQYPHVNSWMKRIAAQPNYLSMP